VVDKKRVRQESLTGDDEKVDVQYRFALSVELNGLEYSYFVTCS